MDAPGKQDGHEVKRRMQRFGDWLMWRNHDGAWCSVRRDSVVGLKGYQRHVKLYLQGGHVVRAGESYAAVAGLVHGSDPNGLDGPRR